MLEVAKGAEFPLVTDCRKATRSLRPSTPIWKFSLRARRHITNRLLFQLTPQESETKITGTVPATLSDFKIEPPTLLTLPVKNEIPIRVEMTWHRQ